MNYTCRPGVKLTKICGDWFLIPSWRIYENYPHILRLKTPSALIWKMIEKSRSKEEMCHALAVFMHIKEESAKEIVDTILQSFIEKNVIIIMEDEK